jgi:hypothetical protein
MLEIVEASWASSDGYGAVGGLGSNVIAGASDSTGVVRYERFRY